MSKADISIRETGGLNNVPTDRWLTASGQIALIEAGEPAKQNATADENVILLVDADLTIASDQPMAGIAAADSSDTVAAAGYVDLYVPLPGIKWEIKEKTSTLANTQAKIDAFIGSLFLVDLDGTSGDFTMDSASATASTAAFLIVGGDHNRSTVWFRIRPDACSYGRASV